MSDTRVHPPLSATTMAEARRSFVPSIDGLWAAIAVLLPAVVTWFGTTPAIDLAYQVRAGNIMLDSRRVLDVDPFTFTVVGQPWLNQQWGAQVLLALIHGAGGWGAILFASGVLVAATAFFVYRSCRAVGASPRTACLLTVGGCLVAMEILRAMRPQQFGCMLFAACVWIVSTRRAAARRVWFVPVLVVAWANLHGSFPLVFVVLGLAWLHDRRIDPRTARRLLVVAGLSGMATLINPYGLRVWSYVADLSTHPVISDRVSEWSPPSIRTPTGALFLGSLLVVGAFLARRGTKTTWLSLVGLGVLAVLSILALRGVVWWALGAPVILAEIVHDGERRRAPDRHRFNVVFAAALALLVAIAVPLDRGTDARSGGPTVLSVAPERLVAAAREAAPTGSRAFVSQITASWSEYSAPGFPVAVDSRIEIFPEAIWEDYLIVSSGREGWTDLLDAWNVTVLILDREQAAGLLEVIGAHPEWRVVERNDDGAVYVRSSVTST
jgi:hypothetical protein